MARVRSGGHGHRVSYLGHGAYRLSWRYDAKVSGRRYTFTRSLGRDTDKVGAERFCRKWGCKMPEEPKT